MSDSPFDDVENEQVPKQRTDFSISSLLSAGLDGTLSVTGGIAIAALTVVSALTAVFVQSIFLTVFDEVARTIRDPAVADAFREALRENAALDAAFDIPVAVSAVALLVLPFFGEAIRIVFIRAFHADEYNGIPGDLATRRLGWAVLSAVVGGVLVGIAVTFGLIALIIPGVIIFIGTVMFKQEIAIADKGMFKAVRGSWELTKEYRWELFGLYVLLFVIGVGVGIGQGVLGTIVTLGTGTAVVDIYLIRPLVTSAVTVFTIATVTEAYGRLVRVKRGSGGNDDEWGTDDQDDEWDTGSQDDEWDTGSQDDEWGSV